MTLSCQRKRINVSIILAIHPNCATAVRIAREGTGTDTGLSSDLTDVLLGWTDSQMSGVIQTPVSTQPSCWIRFDHSLTQKCRPHPAWLSQGPYEANKLPALPPGPPPLKKHANGGNVPEFERLAQPSVW